MEERGLLFILFVLAVAFTSVNCSCKSDLRHLKYCLKNNTLVYEAKVCSRVFCKDRYGADKAEEEEILRKFVADNKLISPYPFQRNLLQAIYKETAKARSTTTAEATTTSPSPRTTTTSTTPKSRPKSWGTTTLATTTTSITPRITTALATTTSPSSTTWATTSSATTASAITTSTGLIEAATERAEPLSSQSPSSADPRSPIVLESSTQLPLLPLLHPSWRSTAEAAAEASPTILGSSSSSSTTTNVRTTSAPAVTYTSTETLRPITTTARNRTNTAEAEAEAERKAAKLAQALSFSQNSLMNCRHQLEQSPHSKNRNCCYETRQQHEYIKQSETVLDLLRNLSNLQLTQQKLLETMLNKDQITCKNGTTCERFTIFEPRCTYIRCTPGEHEAYPCFYDANKCHTITSHSVCLKWTCHQPPPIPPSHIGNKLGTALIVLGVFVCFILLGLLWKNRREIHRYEFRRQRQGYHNIAANMPNGSREDGQNTQTAGDGTSIDPFSIGSSPIASRPPSPSTGLLQLPFSTRSPSSFLCSSGSLQQLPMAVLPSTTPPYYHSLQALWQKSLRNNSNRTNQSFEEIELNPIIRTSAPCISSPNA